MTASWLNPFDDDADEDDNTDDLDFDADFAPWPDDVIQPGEPCVHGVAPALNCDTCYPF